MHPFAYPKVVHTFNKVTKELEEILKYVPSITHGLMSDDTRGRARARQQVRVVFDEDEYVSYMKIGILHNHHELTRYSKLYTYSQITCRAAYL